MRDESNGSAIGKAFKGQYRFILDLLGAGESALVRAIKSSVAGLLCVMLSINIAADDSVFYLSDEERIALLYETNNYCLIWLARGRNAHELDRRKKHPNFPEGHWYNLSKNSLRLTGSSKVPSTSLSYILGEKMLDMAFSGIDPEVTGRTIYNECMKYDPEFSDISNSDPNPKLRSPARAE